MSIVPDLQYIHTFFTLVLLSFLDYFQGASWRGEVRELNPLLNFNPMRFTSSPHGWNRLSPRS